jgi:signal transduction histidine kinase
MEKEMRILMLEDYQEDVGLIEHALRKDGLVFVSRRVDARDEFIDALSSFRPDVILSDHALPQFNSLEALKICQKADLNVPFILVTGTVSEEFAVSCLKLGADDYVLKSNLTRLPSAIQNSMRQKSIEQQRKHAERVLRTQNEELVKINKELDSFVYSVSHNIRAPLMSVLGLLNLARMDDTGHDVLSNYFGMMEASIHKLDHTLKEILDYSRNARSDIRSEPIAVRELIEEGFERLKYMKGSDQIHIDLQIDASAPLYSDAYRLTVILNNLISNAIKYRDTTKKQSFIHIRVRVNEASLRIHFEDNGIGVSPELTEKIFQMFFRATERSEGAGLGLYIVKETVNKLNGTINLSSGPGLGTAFDIEIPNLSAVNGSQSTVQVPENRATA